MTQIGNLNKNELAQMIRAYAFNGEPNLSVWPYNEAGALRDAAYGKRVYLRGLVEITSHCARDCFYCGLRRSNTGATRYRLSEENILSCCGEGYRLGLRTFVLQGGEDAAMTDAVLCRLIANIKEACPGCAVTLSLGERSGESYRALWRAGADRYLLRHETADAPHFNRLHPPEQTLNNRKRCLFTLREIGFQVGAGFMVGSPGQTAETLAEDILFLRELRPHMVGIGPFLPHGATPFAAKPAGTVQATLAMLAIARLTLPKALIPATTALSSLHPQGRILGLAAGANVVMPNLSPPGVRKSYSIYDNKRTAGSEAAEGLILLKEELAAAGYAVDLSRGDYNEFSL